jgi:hypothetical protein
MQGIVLCILAVKEGFKQEVGQKYLTVNNNLFWLIIWSKKFTCFLHNVQFPPYRHRTETNSLMLSVVSMVRDAKYIQRAKLMFLMLQQVVWTCNIVAWHESQQETQALILVYAP